MVQGIVDTKDAGEGVEHFNGLLSPGFINCHCHLELSHMKGLIPKHTGLVDFVFKVVNERHFEEAEILAAIQKGEDELLKNGIVATGDICNYTLTIPQKTKERLHYHNFIEASGFPPSVAETRFDRSRIILESYRSTSNLPVRQAGLQHSTISPHAPYSVSPEMFGIINEFPNNDIISIHNQETAAENEFFEKGSGELLRMYEKMGIDISFFKPSGKSSLQTWFPYFNKGQSIILVHNVHTSAEDLEFIKKTTDDRPRTNGLPTPHSRLSTFLCLCPNANLYISNTLPDVNLLSRHHCNIVLGTDSLASNDQLSILEEIRTLHKNFPSLNLSTLLQWATINGARALQMDDQLGSFEKGKMPGVILIEGTDERNVGSVVRRIL